MTTESMAETGAAQKRTQLAQFLRETEKAMRDPQLRQLLERLESGQYGPVNTANSGV